MSDPVKRWGVALPTSCQRTSPVSLDDPVVITCSISGSLANRDQCPAIPYTPEEYGAEARRIVDEGGVMVHIHARRPDGTSSYEVEDFPAITEAIKGEVGDALIINYSTGAMGVSVEKRLEYLRELKPDVAALNMGSMNYAKYSAKRKAFVFDAVFANPFSEIITFLEAINELGIKPEHECFDLGHVGSLAPLGTSARARRWSTGACSPRRCTSTSSWASSAACPRRPTTCARWPTTC